MRCEYHEAGLCRSCTRLGQPYAAQLAERDAAARATVGSHPGLAWESPAPSRESGFRTKSAMVAAGTREHPTLGLLGPDGTGVDLTGCGLLSAGGAAAMPVLREFVTLAGLRPYDVPRRTGELKYVHVVEAADGALLVRFVLRSEGQIGRLRRHLPLLSARLPQVAVVSVNLLPEHKAVTEGAQEVVLTERTTLPMRVGDVTLHVGPGAFVQTNTQVAGELYRTARDWAGQADAGDVLDLYCGVGGFALHAAAAGREVVGVEISEAAVAAARRSAAEQGLTAQFTAGDATAYAAALPRPPALVIVNPPRRGLSTPLTRWLNDGGVGAVLYSSCNPATLARDLAAMPSLRPVRARLFDMFPQTDHAEVLTLLRRG